MGWVFDWANGADSIKAPRASVTHLHHTADGEPMTTAAAGEPYMGPSSTPLKGVEMYVGKKEVFNLICYVA